MCTTAKVVKVSYTSPHIICFKQCHPLWALVEPPLCHTGISSPGVECAGKSLCANSSLAAGHRRPVCQALICLACFIIHTECWMSMGGLWWIISWAVGDLQMTGQSVWCEQAHGGGEREMGRGIWYIRLGQMFHPKVFSGGNEKPVLCLNSFMVSGDISMDWDLERSDLEHFYYFRRVFTICTLVVSFSFYVIFGGLL